MTIPESRPFPRPCAISSHQFHIEGLCLLITTDGHAVVELGDGNVSLYDLKLGSLYSIRFLDTDRPPAPIERPKRKKPRAAPRPLHRPGESFAESSARILANAKKRLKP